jgi:lysophospholipase L1-like esterase
MSRVILAAGVATFLSVVSCAVQTSQEPEATEVTQALTSEKPYLALGDSVAFGYNPVDAVIDPKNDSAFTGYPELVTELGPLSPYPVSNPACPGETSGSFITYGAPDNGCQAWRAADDAMHVTYSSNTETQLEFALAFLAANKRTATVSLGIGANDLLLVLSECEARFPTSDPNYATDVTNCELALVPGAIEVAASNIAHIATAIREGGYAGQLVLVTYYALEYSNPSDATYQSVVGLDEAMVAVAQGYPQLHLSIARGFSAFEAVADLAGGGNSCTAGLLYKLPDGTCDIHPSELGQAVLAAAVAAAVSAEDISLDAAIVQF